MKRRDFIAGLGSAAAWPLAAGAQQPNRMRRIGVLNTFASDDAEGQARNAAFLQGLQQLGWSEASNIRKWPERPTGVSSRAAHTSYARSRLGLPERWLGLEV